MAHAGVAGNGFNLHGCLRLGTADEQLLEGPVLIAQGNFQVQNILPVTLKAEMARLDNTGMHRSDTHLVYFRALDPEIVYITGYGVCSGIAAPGISGGIPGSVEADRLEPWMTGKANPVLFSNLSLEEMQLGQSCCQ